MKGRIRDRRVYLASNPFMLLALELARRVKNRGRTVRPGRGGAPSRVIVDTAEGVRHVLLEVPLDRQDERTTGGLLAREGSEGDSWFDGEGKQHRDGRRDLSAVLGSAGVEKLRPLWAEVLDEYVAELRRGPVDTVRMTRIMSGKVACQILGIEVTERNALKLSSATRRVASAAVVDHLTGKTTDHLKSPLEELLPGAPTSEIMLAVAATTTVQSAIPRALAWCADDNLWDDAASNPKVMAAELTRVIAPSPLLPRVAAGDATVQGCPVRAGTQLLLYLLPAISRAEPSVKNPQPAAVSQLAFGVGPHACPGRRLALEMTADALAAFAPLRPRVHRAKADRQAGLPQWLELWLTL